jgi:hypothetical protein
MIGGKEMNTNGLKTVKRVSIDFEVSDYEAIMTLKGDMPWSKFIMSKMI